MDPALVEAAAALSRQHRPYVVATVVRAVGPTSGKAGYSALIEPDGTVTGWIGGACAEPAVLRQARQVLRDGGSVLLRLGPDDDADGDRDDVVRVPLACASEGTLEVFLEAVLPAPHVALVGSSPAVETLAGLLEALGWRGTVTEPELVGGLVPDAVVVATQGHDDESALVAALAAGAPYVGLVASRRRADGLRRYLTDHGWGADDLARLRSPAGLDLGRTEHREIAVAILAELVALRARGELTRTVPAPAPPETAIDPVCGMTVDVTPTALQTEHDGRIWYFCGRGCLETFVAAPDRYVVGHGSA